MADEDIYRDAVSPEDADAFIAGVNTAVTHPEAFTGPRPGAGNVGAYKGGREALANIGGGAVQTDAFLANEEEENRRWEEAAQMRALGTVMGIGAEAGERIRVEHARQERFGKAIAQFAPFMLGEWDKHPERREAAVKIYGEDAIREYEGLNAENKDLWIGMKWSDAVKDEGESGGEWQTRRFKEAGYPTDDEDLLKGGYGSWWRRDKKRLLPALQQQAKDAEEDERYVDAMISGKEIPESLQGLRAGFMKRVRPESLAKVQRVAAWAKQNLGYARGADWASTKLRRLNANEMTESLAELISDGRGGIDPEMRGLAERMLDGFAKEIKYGDSPSAVGEFMIAAGRLLHSVGNSLSEGDALRDAERKEAEVRELEDRLAGKSRGSEFMERMQREGGVQSEFMRRNAGTFMNTERGRAEAAALERREAEERRELEARLAKAREDAAALREKADEEMAVRVARGMVSNATDVATELDKSRPWYWQATVGAARVVGEVAGQTSAYLAGTAAAAGMAAIPGVGTAAAAAAAIGIGSSAELMRAREEEYNRNLAQGMSPEAARNEAMITGTINAAVEMMPGSALGGAGATSLLRWGSRRGSRIATEILNWGTRSTARAWGVETGAAVLDESILEPLGQGILQWGASNACDALGVPHGKTKEFRKNFDELSAILNDPVQLAGTMIFCGVLSAGGAVKIGKHTGSIRATVDYMKVQREHLEAEGFTAEQTEQVMAQGEGKARAELCRKFEEYNREHDGEATLRRKLAAAQRMKEEGRALDYTGIMSITKEGKTVGEALQEAMKRSYGRYVRQGMLPDVQRNEDGSVHVRKLREGTGEVEYEMDCSEEEANNVVAVEMRDVERRQRERIREADLEGYDLRRAILKATEREVGAGMQKAAEGAGLVVEDITKHVGPEIAERIRKEGRVTFEIAQDITAWAKGMIDGLTGQGMSEAEARASVWSDSEASGHAQTLGWWADFADNFVQRAKLERDENGKEGRPENRVIEVFTTDRSYGLDGSSILGNVLYTAAKQSHSSILEDVSEGVLKDLVRQRAEVLMNEGEGRSAEEAAEQAWEELAAKVERANEAVAKADPEAKLVRVSREKDGRIKRMSVVEGVSKLAVAKFLGSDAVPVWLKEFQDLSDGLLSAATAIGTVQKAYAAALEAEPEKLRDMEGLLGKMGVAVRNVFAEARLEARERTATVASTAKEEARAQGPGGVGGEGFSKVRAEQEEADREQEERERARVAQEGQDRERTDEGARVAYESEEDAGEAAGEGTENAPADMRKLFVGGTCVYNKAGGYYVGLIRKADIRLGLAQVKQGEKGRYGEIAGKELTGDFEPTAAPLYIWLRRDGTAELISGRHRFSKMMEDERVVAHLCYVFREDAEHNEKWAKMLDYENNMRDDQADEKTAAIYIREMPQADEELYRKGLLRNNSRSKRGLFIGRHARQALFERFLSDNISAKDTETLCRLTYNLRVEEKRIDEIQGLAASAFVGGKGWEYTVGLIQALAAAEGIEEVKQGMFDFGSEWQATAEKFAKFIELSLKAITAYQSAARAGMKTSGADKEKAALMGYTTSNDEAQAWKVQALAEARAKYEMAGSHREIIEAAVIWDGKSKIDPVPKILRDYAIEHFGSEEEAEKANEEPEDDGMGDLFSANMSERRGGERVVRMKDGSTAVVTRAGDVDPNMSAFVIGKHAENWEKYAERAFEGRDDGMMRAELDISEAKLKEDKLLIPRDFKGWLSDDLGYNGEADSVQPIVLTLWHKYHEKEGVPEALRRDTRQFIEDVKNEAEVKDKERKADIRWAVKAGTELLKEAQRMGSLKKAGKLPAKERRMLKAILATAAYEPGLWARKPLQDLLKARALTADGKLTLGDIFDCPALFEAYPYLSDLPVVIQELQGLLGVFYRRGKKWNKDPKKAWIEVTPNVSEEGFKSTLVHEVQHAIQDIEGFDYGTYKGIKEKGLSKDEAYWLMPGEIESRNVSRRMNWGPLERYGTAFNETLEFPGRALVSRKKKGSGKAKGTDVWVAFSASMERRAEVKNLGAVHILPAYSLEQADRLGGMPVPSVAITRLDRPYKWGDTEEMVTLVGSPDLVDPARGARVYSRDAWTGRVPEIEEEEKVGPFFFGLEDEDGNSIPSVATLENLTEYMKATKKRGAEAKSRDYKPLGVVRALTAEELPSMEAIRKNRDRLQEEDEYKVRHEEVMKLDEMLREDYDVYLGDDEWRAVFEAVADLEEVTEESAKKALEDWTDADGKPDLSQLQKSEALKELSEWLIKLTDVVNRLRSEKRDYFEAIPMRAVMLSDWKLALVSKEMDEDAREGVKDICFRHGIEYKEYEGGERGREKELAALVGGDLSFSMNEVTGKARNLGAVHRIDAATLDEAASMLGGMPVPSVAITRLDRPYHWGREEEMVTLVGSPDLVDPARGAEVYSRDAWTGRVPDFDWDDEQGAPIFYGLEEDEDGESIPSVATLENLTEYMAETKKRGAEAKSRDYEPLGVVRALTAERLPSMEAIRKNRDRLQSEDEHRVRHEEVMKLDEMLREDYDVYLGDDEWRAVFEAVADLEEVTEESAKEALENWTDTDDNPDLYQLQSSEALDEGSEWLTELAEVVNRLRDEKRDYFEALPRRAVMLSDWKLALVSKAMDESTRERIKELCEENGIEYREYERFGYEDALKELVGSDLSFSMSEVEQTERVMRILQWHRENEAEGHAVAEEWGKFARILALRSAGGGAGGSLQGSEVMARMVALLAATRRVLPRDWRNARGVSAMLAWAGWYAKMAEAGEVQGTDILKGAVYEKVLAGLKEEAEVKAAQGGEAAVKAWLRDNMGVKLDTMTERLAGKCRAMIDRYICGRMREDMLRSIERLYPEREPGQQVRMGKLPADTYRYIRLVKEALSMNEAWVRAGAARAEEEAALAAKLRRGDLSAEQKERYAAQLAELRDTAVNELADEVERLQAAAEDEERSEAERKEAQLKAHVLSIYACWDKRGYAECVSAAEDFRRVTQEGREVWDERQKERRDKMAYIKERVRKGKGWATSGEKMNEKIEERAGKDSKAKDVSLTSGLAYTSMAGKLYAAAKKFGGWFVSKYTRRIADMHKELKAAQDDNSTWLFRELARVSGRNTVAGISDFIREASEIAATGIEVEQVQRRVFRISGKSLAEWLVMSAEEREAERARLAAEGKANERLRRDIPSEEILEELEIDYANDRNAGFARKEYIYITESKEKHEIRSSKLGVLQAILTAEQPYYDHLMADNGITEAVLERMKEYVGPELLALGYGMRERLAEKRGAVAAMHERIYGVPFDAHANYFPGKFENEGTADLEGDGKVQAGSSGMPGRPGSMKTRRIHYRKIDWAASALDSFCTVLRQQDNWLITGDFIAEWGDMFRDKDFAQEMIGNLGRKWIEFMKADIRTLADARDAELSLGAITRMVGAVCSAAAKTRLAFNPVTIVKNATSLLNCWVGGQVPITEISESGAARVLDERGVGLLEFLAGARGEFTLKDIAAQDFIRVRTTKREGRIHEAINEGAREKGAGTRMRHALAGVEGAALRGQEIGMAGIEKADVGGNILSAMMLANAVYRSLERDSQARHLSREEKRRVALEYAQKALDYVAQPFTAGQKVTAANKASWGGVLANATMYLFRSEQLAKFGMAVADIMSGEAGRAARGSAYFLLVGGSAWLAGQVCLYLLGELGRALTGGDEPEDLFKDSEDFLKNFVASGVAGEIAVVPFIGEAVNAGVRRAAGLRVYMQGDTWGTAVAPFRRFAKAETPAEEVKSVCGMLQSAASVGGAVGIYARPVKSLTDLLLLVGGMKNIPEKVSGRFVRKK